MFKCSRAHPLSSALFSFILLYSHPNLDSAYHLHANFPSLARCLFWTSDSHIQLTQHLHLMSSKNSQMLSLSCSNSWSLTTGDSGQKLYYLWFLSLLHPHTQANPIGFHFKCIWNPNTSPFLQWHHPGWSHHHFCAELLQYCNLGISRFFCKCHVVNISALRAMQPLWQLSLLL